MPDQASNETEAAFAALEKYARGSGRAALMALDEAVASASCEAAGREKMEQRLLESLERCTSNPAREYVCSKLVYVGGERSVPALKRMLSDPELSAPARTALEAVGGGHACQALREALPGLAGPQKAGAAYSLGRLRDSRAVRLLARLLREEDEAVASAGVVALGNIGTASAARVLRGFEKSVPPGMRAKYRDACLGLRRTED